MAQERIQKILARAGIASRRAAEELISSGRVKVNGKTTTELGAKADPRKDRVEVDGKLVAAERPVYVLLHKPRGVMCTMSDPEGRPTVAQYVADVEERIVPVGRLDFHTSGVLLMTNDGDFAAAMAHPTKRVEKIYVAKLRGVLGDEAIEGLCKPILIDGKPTQPAAVRRLRVEGDKTWVEFTLHEGRNRQIHRVTEAAGSAVFRLARLKFAGLTADNLRPGQWRYLTKDELRDFKEEYGVPKRVVAPPAPPSDDKLARTRQRVENIRTADKQWPGKRRDEGEHADSDLDSRVNARTRKPARGAKRGSTTRVSSGKVSAGRASAGRASAGKASRGGAKAAAPRVRSAAAAANSGSSTDARPATNRGRVPVTKAATATRKRPKKKTRSR